MPVYEKAPKSVETLARAVIKRFDRHEHLRENKVVIGYYFASPDVDSYGMLRGYDSNVIGDPDNGGCKLMGQIDRMKNGEHVEILLDKVHCEAATENQQMALLHHELYHVCSHPTDKNDDAT